MPCDNQPNRFAAVRHLCQGLRSFAITGSSTSKHLCYCAALHAIYLKPKVQSWRTNESLDNCVAYMRHGTCAHAARRKAASPSLSKLVVLQGKMWLQRAVCRTLNGAGVRYGLVKTSCALTCTRRDSPTGKLMPKLYQQRRTSCALHTHQDVSRESNLSSESGDPGLT